MDDSRFDSDAFAQKFGPHVSRRGLVHGLAGGALATTLAGGVLRLAPPAAAQQATLAVAGSHWYQVGELDVIVLSDGTATVPGAFYAVNAPPTELAEVLTSIDQTP